MVSYRIDEEHEEDGVRVIDKATITGVEMMNQSRYIAPPKRNRPEDLDDPLSIVTFWVMSVMVGIMVGWTLGQIAGG